MRETRIDKIGDGDRRDGLGFYSQYIVTVIGPRKAALRVVGSAVLT